MNKHELLVPAGNMDCLKQAVYNGCDAVYLACKCFGARKFADNFDNDEIVEAIKFCHLYGVKLFVTMNTLVKDSEVEDFLEQAYFLHVNGVDALIVQDFGMICLLREKYPNLEIHVSTQANISSSEVCKLYYDLGVKRVVFARELSIDEIDSIDVPIEKEAFIHGALCISYSGECLMSSMLGGRSGNRGECAGCCRMPFTLKQGDKTISSDKYLLSTKELNTSSEIKRLLSSSIYSFKIEGRMKSPLYVGFITRLYRRLIDGEELNLSDEIDKLKTIFNRSFTKGRMFGVNDKSLMNIESPNHIGLEIGKVVEVNKKKIKIQLNKGYELNQYDAIRFLNSKKGFIVNFLYDKKDNLINSSDYICYVDNKVGLEFNDIVCKTQDYLLEKEFEKINNKKINISFKVIARKGEPLKIEISDYENTILEEGGIVEKANNAPLSEYSIIKQLSKLGDSPFSCNNFDVCLDNDIFIQIRELNEIRRLLVSKLIETRENKKIDVVVNDVLFDKNNFSKTQSLEKVCKVYNREQLDCCLSLNFKRIYVNDYDLYCEYSNYGNVYYSLPRCSFDFNYDKGLVSDYCLFSNHNYYGNYSLNVFNIYTAYYLNKMGLMSIPISVELSSNEVLELINKYNDKFGYCEFEIFVYGLIENMVIKGNILDIDSNCFDYKLIDFKNRSFNVYYDGLNTHIFNYECRNITNEFVCGVLRYDFYNETANSIKRVVNE